MQIPHASQNRVTAGPGRRSRNLKRSLGVATGASLLVLATAVAAGAHVTVHSADAKPGGKNVTLVFRVPNEESKAKTTKIEIDLPTATPLTGVAPKTPAGWSAVTTTDKIVFTGGSIGGDDSVDFPVKVAQLPNVDKLVFKALQTYSNGDVVRWIEEAPPGAPEPAHPAPTLDLHNPNVIPKDPDASVSAAGTATPAATTSKAPGALSTKTPMVTKTPDAATVKVPDAATVKVPTAATTKMPAVMTTRTPDAVITKTPMVTKTPDALTVKVPDAAATAKLPDGMMKMPDGTMMKIKDMPGAGAPATPKAPVHVHAGSGGQAASGGIPAAPLAMVALGVGAAALVARRLARG